MIVQIQQFLAEQNTNEIAIFGVFTLLGAIYFYLFTNKTLINASLLSRLMIKLVVLLEIAVGIYLIVYRFGFRF